MAPPSRRRFLAASAAAGAGFWVTGVAAANLTPRSPNEKLRIAGIGVGGKGRSDIVQAGKFGEVVAICDIDESDYGTGGALKDLEKNGGHKPKTYFDYRKMFDEMGKDIDAVVVSTPDHTHAVASMMAIKLGKHVYCQKPLTHFVFEARKLREAANDKKVVTQMGNQGTAENGLRRAVELVQGGVLGQVKEIHVWTNRPVWPQAPEIVDRPKDTPAVPSHIHWDEFLGPSPERPYHSAYHPFKWRGWWDYGTGALGDMACHTANMAFMACKLGYPTAISAVNAPLNNETYPAWAAVCYEFPARGDMQPCKMYWYEGRVLTPDGRKASLVQPPTDLVNKVLRRETVEGTAMIEKLADSGSIIVGDKAILFSPNDYGAKFRLYREETEKDSRGRDRKVWKEFPKEEMDSLLEGKSGPPVTLARNGGGDSGMKKEWVEAIRGGARPFANFDYAALFTETMLLGNVAMRAGQRLEWDGPNMRVTNHTAAQQFIQPDYRKGWSL
jgi:predicted dehydrogenase